MFLLFLGFFSCSQDEDTPRIIGDKPFDELIADFSSSINDQQLIKALTADAIGTDSFMIHNSRLGWFEGYDGWSPAIWAALDEPSTGLFRISTCCAGPDYLFLPLTWSYDATNRLLTFHVSNEGDMELKVLAFKYPYLILEGTGSYYYADDTVRYVCSFNKITREAFMDEYEASLAE